MKVKLLFQESLSSTPPHGDTDDLIRGVTISTVLLDVSLIEAQTRTGVGRGTPVGVAKRVDPRVGLGREGRREDLTTSFCRI